MGGRLRGFAQRWARVTSNAWVLETLRDGYCLEFREPPPPQHRIRITQRVGPEIRAEVDALLAKRAIEPVPQGQEVGGFFSTFFLTPKKTGGMRPILNVKPLNQYMVKKHFRMDHLGVVVKDLEQGLWAVSLDLTDAYLHVPLRPSHSKFLRFALSQEEQYQFTCLCFGLSTAPRVFTKIMVEIGAFMRQRGVRIYQYLDDWLLVGNRPEEVSSNRDFLLNLVEHLGLLVNWKKSELVPSQTFTYLGARFFLRDGAVGLSEERKGRVRETVGRLLHSPRCVVRTFLEALGVLASCIGVLPQARLRMRPLQLYLLSCWRPVTREISLSIPLRESLTEHWQWWLSETNLSQTTPFRPVLPSWTLVTDASRYGWGGFLLEGPSAQGRWTAEEQRLHINVLELKAVQLCLMAFESLVTGTGVLVRSDNTSVVSYINRQGGTRSPTLCYRAWDLWHWCLQRETSLQAAHIAGVENRWADMLSRQRVSPTEWQLHRGVVKHLFGRLGRPNIDLFASEANAQLPTYCSWRLDPYAFAIDGLSIPWGGILAYAYPPVVLIPKVIMKMLQEPCRVLLIAPLWPGRAWFPRLLDLLCETPILLPDREDLLTQRRGRNVHPEPGLFKLVAWPLSSVPCEAGAFHEQLRGSSRGPSAGRQGRSTHVASELLSVGVLRGKRIPLARM